MKKLLFYCLIISLGIFISCSDDETEDTKNQWPTNSWEKKSLDEVGIDATSIEALVRDIEVGRHGYLHSMLIVRDRYLVSEYYFNGSHINDVHQLQSAGKSVSSVLTGIAIDKDYISEDEKILEIFKRYTVQNVDSLKTQISVKNVLTMKHGFLWREWGYSDDQKDNYIMMSADDWVQYVLDRPMDVSPGTVFNYSTGVSVLMCGMIDERSLLKTEAFADENLFNPIGIRSDNWWVKDKADHVHTGGGLSLTSRDMARFGLLILNDGTWDGDQIISGAYLDRSLTIDSYNAITLNTGSEYINMHYGYQWWILPVRTSDGTLISVSTALGKGGQSIFIAHELNLVVVFTAWELNYYPTIGIFKDTIIPAVR